MEELIPITFFISIAAVLILRPVTKRLGMLIEAVAREKDAARAPARQDERVIALLEGMNRRLDLMEDRIEFTERLVSARRREQDTALIP